MDNESAENEIRIRLKADDSSALTMIWNEYSPVLLGYLTGMHCSRQEAEDSLQDVFVTIARKRSSVAKAQRLKPYLFKLARNLALNRIKRNRRNRERDHEFSDWLVIDGDGEQRDERTQQIEAALASLPEKQRSVVVLKVYQEITLREIAELLGISENTAGSRLRYGMQKLREQLRPNEA